MAKPPMGEGFRFTKLMAWAPAIFILVGALFFVLGQTSGDRGMATIGLLIALMGIIYGLVVKRRARRTSSEELARK